MAGREIDIYRQCDLNNVVGATEAGDLIKLRRGVVNPNTAADEQGNFFRCTDSGDSTVYQIDKSGHVGIGGVATAGFDAHIHGEIRADVTTDALGGGAAATLGTIGGTGPTVAGQNLWARININGTPYWIPVWI